MKTTVFNIILLLLCLGAKAQQTRDTAATAGTPNIWLTNSNKAIVKQDGATVDRAFFTADKVYIGSNNKRFKKEDQIHIMIFGAKGSVMSNESALLSEPTKKRILNEPAGTRIIFMRGHRETFTEMTIILQ
jgi:hypothetical protein